MFMSKNEFMKWAELTATDFFRKEIDSDYLMYKVSTKKRMVAIFNMNTGNYGIAKCKRTDEFIPTVGFAIAWARYCKKDIPVIAERVSYEELNVGDWIWHRSGENESYEKFMIERKSTGIIGANLPYQATTFDFDLVSEDGLRREHVSHFDCCYCTGLKKFWKVID